MDYYYNEFGVPLISTYTIMVNQSLFFPELLTHVGMLDFI